MWGSLMTDIIEFLLDRQFIEARKWQAQEEANSAFEDHEGISEGFFNLFRRAGDGSRVRNAPMGRHGLAWPDRTDLFGRVIANCENKMEFRRSEFGKFVPILAARPIGRQFRVLQLLQRLGMNTSCSMASCAVGGEVRETPLVHDGLRHDGPGRIPSAEKQDVIVRRHDVYLSRLCLPKVSAFPVTEVTA